MTKNIYLFGILLIFVLSSCVEVRNPYEKIPPGIWRATLTIGNDYSNLISTDNETELIFTELTDGELPFNFEASYADNGQLIIEILNDEERILLKDVTFGKNKKTLQDTIVINFPVYDSYIKGIYEEDKIQGHWFVNYRENYKVPFSAVFGQSHRFTNLKRAPTSDLTGKWESTFEIGTEDEFKGIGEFVQDGNQLKGTFRTETGDYRFLEGTVQGNKAYLSCFDGAHAFLFQAKILDDGTLTGSFRSGSHYVTTWKAFKNEDFELTDPNKLTFIEGQENFFFTFPDTEGNMLSIVDEKFNDKPMLVCIFGTWCPNCRDEMIFLRDYFNQNSDLDIPVVAIGFEKYRDEKRSMDVLRRYKSKLELPFDFVLGGYFEKSEAINQLPMLNKIISYPTLIALDENKDVVQIHTGYSGPATSKFEDFKNNFDQLIETLTDEK